MGNSHLQSKRNNLLFSTMREQGAAVRKYLFGPEKYKTKSLLSKAVWLRMSPGIPKITRRAPKCIQPNLLSIADGVIVGSSSRNRAGKRNLVWFAINWDIGQEIVNFPGKSVNATIAREKGMTLRTVQVITGAGLITVASDDYMAVELKDLYCVTTRSGGRYHSLWIVVQMCR